MPRIFDWTSFKRWAKGLSFPVERSWSSNKKFMSRRAYLTRGVVLFFEGHVARADLIIFLKKLLLKAGSHNLELEFPGDVFLRSLTGSIGNRTSESTEIYTRKLFHQSKSESLKFLIRVHALEDNPASEGDFAFVEFVFTGDLSVRKVSSHLREETIDIPLVSRAPSGGELVPSQFESSEARLVFNLL
ncbi:hypothetical protein LB504_006492 [Fusarium proliferatum]|nr:hypothetical protein LB504_006492 [Fusarium proliferatum]